MLCLVSWLVEPRWQGRTANAWFKEVSTAGGGSGADAGRSALVSMGDNSAAYLAEVFTHQDGAWKQSLIQWARARGWTSSPSERRRASWAAQILREIGPNGRRAVPCLVRAARDRTHPRRAGAIELLGVIHRDPPLAIPTLVDCLRETNGYVRTFAATALGSFGAEGRAAVPALWEALGSQDTYLAVASASALLRIDEKSDAGWPLLMDTLRSPVATHRVEAARALGNLGPIAWEAVPALRAALADQDPRVSSAAASALQRVNP